MTQKLNTELAEQKKLTEDYLTQLLSLESEMDYMRDQNNASSEAMDQSHSRTGEHLKDKYESLETRRRTKAQGFQTNVKILKEKLRHVEQKLVRAKVKEHDYIKTISAYKREIDKLKRSLKTNGEGQN